LEFHASVRTTDAFDVFTCVSVKKTADTEGVTLDVVMNVYTL
jgi:hypothetical protein